MMQNSEDVTLNFGEEEEHRGRVIKHPVAVACHLTFRILAVLAYLLCNWFSSSFIGHEVGKFLGRLLVGLRWWNHVDENGQSHWVYEARKGAAASVLVTNTESRIFWLSLVIVQVIWVVFFFATLFTLSFKWFMVVCVGNALNGANLYGYIKCKVGANNKISSVASNFLGRHVLKSMLSGSTNAAQTSGPGMPQR